MTGAKKRSHQHIIDQRGEQLLRAKLPQHWVIREYRPDYGLDFTIELFKDGDEQKGRAATYETLGEHVFVQLKSVASPEEQNTRNQRRELKAVAERHGWEVTGLFEDAGISGGKGREHRPGLEALMKAVSRRECDIVAAWSVDRLGRSLTDLLDMLKELHAKGVVAPGFLGCNPSVTSACGWNGDLCTVGCCAGSNVCRRCESHRPQRTTTIREFDRLAAISP